MITIDISNKKKVKADAIYRLSEVCEILGLSRWSIRRMRVRGELLPFSAGRSLRYSGEAILSMMKNISKNRIRK